MSTPSGAFQISHFVVPPNHPKKNRIFHEIGHQAIHFEVSPWKPPVSAQRSPESPGCALPEPQCSGCRGFASRSKAWPLGPLGDAADGWSKNGNFPMKNGGKNGISWWITMDNYN